MKKQYSNKRPNIPINIRRSIEVEAGHQCTVKNCGEHTYLEIHHINQNREDNTIDNLILLCDKHHKMAHDNIIDRKALKMYKNLLNMPIQHHEILLKDSFYKNLIDEFENRILGIGFHWLETLPNDDWSLKIEEYQKLYSLIEWIESRDWIENNDIQNSFKILSQNIQKTITTFEQYMETSDKYYCIDKFYKRVNYYDNPESNKILFKEFENHIYNLIDLTIQVANNFNTIFRIIRRDIDNTFLSNKIISNLHGQQLV